MKIKITEENAAKIEDLCKAANGRARTRTKTADEIIGFADSLESHLESCGCAKAHRKGTRYQWWDGVGCNSYDYRAESTAATIERGSSAWFLVEIERIPINTGRGARTSILTLSDSARESIAASAIRDAERW